MKRGKSTKDTLDDFEKKLKVLESKEKEILEANRKQLEERKEIKVDLDAGRKKHEDFSIEIKKLKKEIEDISQKSSAIQKLLSVKVSLFKNKKNKKIPTK